MHDRDKVIKGLELCGRYGHVCTDCPYDKEGCLVDLKADALALLKEQETVEPVKKDMVEVTSRYEYDCQCGAPLLIGQPYCADCGRAVKWND